MNYLRSLLFLLWQTLTIVPCGLGIVLFSLFCKGERLYRLSTPWLFFNRWGLEHILGVEFRIHGQEHLAQQGAVVLLCKHQSALETLILPTFVRHQMAFVFKRELLFIPFFGWGMARQDMIYIDRKRPTQAFQKVLRIGARLLNNGVWVVMFPEGTRVGRGKVGDYKPGGARLAIKAGVPVIPVAITSARVWPARSFFLKPGVVDIAFGPAIATDARASADIMADVRQWIEQAMQQYDPQAYLVPATPAHE